MQSALFKDLQQFMYGTECSVWCLRVFAGGALTAAACSQCRTWRSLGLHVLLCKKRALGFAQPSFPLDGFSLIVVCLHGLLHQADIEVF